MTGADDIELVAVVGAGTGLADAARRCWDEGRAILPVNPAYTAPEITTLLERLRPTAVVDLGTGETTAYPDGLPAPAGTAAVVVTSGTEGTPKGVELTRAGMEVMGRGYSAGLDAGSADRWLACLPLHHVASLGALARSYVTGVPYTVHDTFDLERVARSPGADGTTIVSLVPTALRRLLDAHAPLHEFRWVITGGAPCPPALRTRAEAASVRVIDAYGLSETWGGFALDGTPIEGAAVRLGAGDEILVRGAMVMRAYRLDPTRTDAVLDPDGWFHTGDVGRIDDAGPREHVEVVDRLKDLVITGGVNVSPTEVEGVLAHHPDVDELRAFARERLSAPKLPRAAHAVDAIPRTASGKPLRRLLRDAPATGAGADR